MAKTPTHEDELLSEKWDSSDGVARRLHYAIFAPQRTGSELLSAYLRQQGLGVPIEYLNPVAAPTIAGRLDSLNDEGHVVAARYWKRVIEVRSKRGVFGTKIQPDQLMIFTQQNAESGRKVIQGFDRLILLRRRDKLAQAISLARAKVTDQWAIYGEREKELLAASDRSFFPAIAESVSKILEDEAFIESMVAGIDAAEIRRLDYEDLDKRTLEETAAWLWDAAGGRPRGVKAEAVVMPTKLDQGEARQVKERFLARIGAW